MLKFGRGNAKLDALEKVVGGKVYTFSLLSGFTCPYAKDCLSKAIRVDGKSTIIDGPDTKFRCFSASEEAMYPNVYDSRNDNLLQLQSSIEMAETIGESVPADAKCIRVHVGGDFFNSTYFNAWMNVARVYRDKLFYAYTKSLPFWIIGKDKNIIPDNFILTASYGGHKDKLIAQHKLRHAVVISDNATCEAIMASGNDDIVPVGQFAGYEIDHDDSHAALPDLRNKSFALLIHGTQPKGTDAAKAKSTLKGVGSYGKGSK